MTRHAVPTEAASLALSIANDADRVRRAQDGYTTVANIDAALAAMMRVRADAANMCLALRRQRSEALTKEREAARDRSAAVYAPSEARV